MANILPHQPINGKQYLGRCRRRAFTPVRGWLIVHGLLVWLALAGLAFADPPLPVITNQVFVVTNSIYGAIGDGLTNNAAAIQSAINDAGTNGGGTVEIPGNGTLSTYLSGPINLTNGINLQIDSGVMLQMLPRSNWPSASTPFINGSKLHDVEISGPGTIDGQGTNWWFPKASSRPNFINFSGCTRVLVQNVTLQNPPTFHLMLKGNNLDLTIQDITINTPFDSPNTDGMDLASTNVLIRNCSISDGDDNIEIGGSAAAAANITVSNCTFGTGHGVSIGSLIQTQFVGDVRGVHDLLVSNCTFNGTENGIRMKSDRDIGGLIQNLRYLDIAMTNVGYPIMIYSFYETVGTPNFITPSIAVADGPQQVITTTPIWQNILISNLTATASTGVNITGIIWGRQEAPVSNLTLCSVNISAPGKTFAIYNARGIQIVNSQFTTDGSTNTLTLYNAQVTATNSAPSANVVTLDGLANPPTNNVLAFFNASATITAINLVGPNPLLTLGSSILTVSNNLNLGGTSTLNFGIGTNATEIAVIGNLSVNGTLNITDAGGFINTTYTLFTYAGTLTDNGITIGTMPSTNFTYTVSTNTVGQVNLVVGSTAPPSDPFTVWQNQYFTVAELGTPSFSGPGADPLGKGMSNTKQLLAGLNPTNSASALRIISVMPKGNDIAITWTTAGVRTNAVQASIGDGNGGYSTNFNDISAPIIIPVSGDATTNYLDSGGATNNPSRYYRIRLVP